VLDPLTYEQYRLSLIYERTDRRGPVFERLRQDVEITAALQGMHSVPAASGGRLPGDRH
jgi:hypothetical protein